MELGEYEAEIVASAAVTSARALINSFVVDFDAITVLIKAMQLSGWIFHMKVSVVPLLVCCFLFGPLCTTILLQGKVYRALARLAGHPLFYDKVKKENGIPVLVYEHRLRRQAQRHATRKLSTASLLSKHSLDLESLGDVHDDDNEDEFTDDLVVRLKRDYACIKIQACCRTFMTRQRHVRLMELLGKLKKGNNIS